MCRFELESALENGEKYEIASALAPNVVNDGIVQFGGCQIHRCLGVTLRLIVSRRDVVAVAPLMF